jgi:hypothetical protein
MGLAIRTSELMPALETMAWLATLSRELLDAGVLSLLIADCAVTGATSNRTTPACVD